MRAEKEDSGTLRIMCTMIDASRILRKSIFQHPWNIRYRSGSESIEGGYQKGRKKNRESPFNLSVFISIGQSLGHCHTTEEGTFKPA